MAYFEGMGSPIYRHESRPSPSTKTLQVGAKNVNIYQQFPASIVTAVPTLPSYTHTTHTGLN